MTASPCPASTANAKKCTIARRDRKAGDGLEEYERGNRRSNALRSRPDRQKKAAPVGGVSWIGRRST